MDQEIIELLKKPSLDPYINLEIEKYISKLSLDISSCDICFNILNDVLHPNDEVAKFIATKILNQQIDMYADKALYIGSKLLNVIMQSINKNIILPTCVLNMIFYIISKLFMKLYINEWDDFQSTLKILIQNEKGLEYYLKIIKNIIDEILFPDLKYPHSECIKNKFRTDFLQQLLNCIYNSCILITTTSSLVINLSLEILSKIAIWNEQQLIFNDNFRNLLAQLFTFEMYRDNVLICYMNFIHNGLTHEDKHKVVLIIYQSIQNSISQQILLNNYFVKYINRSGCYELDYIKSEADHDKIQQSLLFIHDIMTIALSIYNNNSTQDENPFFLLYDFFQNYLLLYHSNIKLDSIFCDYISNITLEKCKIFHMYDDESSDEYKFLCKLFMQITLHYDQYFYHKIFNIINDIFQNIHQLNLFHLSSILLINTLYKIIGFKKLNTFYDIISIVISKIIILYNIKNDDISITLPIIDFLSKFNKLYLNHKQNLIDIIKLITNLEQSIYYDKALLLLLKLISSCHDDLIIKNILDYYLPTCDTILSTSAHSKNNVGPILLKIITFCIVELNQLDNNYNSYFINIFQRLTLISENIINNSIEYHYTASDKIPSNKLSIIIYPLNCMINSFKPLFCNKLNLNVTAQAYINDVLKFICVFLKYFPLDENISNACFDILKDKFQNNDNYYHHIVQCLDIYQPLANCNIIIFYTHINDIIRKNTKFNDEVKEIIIRLIDLIIMNQKYSNTLNIYTLIQVEISKKLVKIFKTLTCNNNYIEYLVLSNKSIFVKITKLITEQYSYNCENELEFKYCYNNIIELIKFLYKNQPSYIYELDDEFYQQSILDPPIYYISFIISKYTAQNVPKIDNIYFRTYFYVAHIRSLNYIAQQISKMYPICCGTSFYQIFQSTNINGYTEESFASTVYHEFIQSNIYKNVI